jgi:radical SAM superfamily enzyme YgiQ (UPF0313 family)
MYTQLKYLRRSPEQIQKMIETEARQDSSIRRIFLADGDVLWRPLLELRDILVELDRHFPQLARVNTYATGSAIAARSDAELRELRALKLQTLYMGLESGDDETLRRVRKKEDAALMVKAAQRAQACGLRMSVMILLGLGGRERTHEHAAATAAAINQMQPRLLSALRVIPVPGTELYGEVQGGRFGQLTEQETIAELERIVERLELKNTVFRADHSSNIVPMEGRFPRDKERLQALLRALLASGRLDCRSPGPTPLWL